jgi:hypothetical protein
MPSSLKDIYNALREDQQFSQTKDYGTFAKRMNERGYSQMIYNNLKTAGASLPDVNTFRKRLGLKDWSAPSTKPVAKSKSQATPSYADYSAMSLSPSSASQGNGVKDKYRYPGLSVPMNTNGTEDTTSSGNESALVRSLRKTGSRKNQPSLRKPIGKVMVENHDKETVNLSGAASEIANEGAKPAYNLGDETTSLYLSKRKSDVAKEHDKVRSVSEAVWDNASKVAGDEFNDYIKDRNEMNFTNVVRELAKGSNPSRMSEDNWEVGTEAMASHLRNHDLEKLSEAAWNALGENGQKDLINDYYSKILQQYPHADHNEVYEEAKKMARAESDNQMYQTAVSKNAPKDVADFFFRKAARTNSVGNIMEANARIKAGTRGDMDARDEADARYEQDHKVAGIAGMAAGFATDPLTAVSGGVGSATAKGATALAGKAFGQAAVRKFGTTLGGKILTGAAAGMGNLGTLEAGSNAAEQLRQGGWRDDEGKFHEGFAEGQVLKQGLHGAGMGALTGVVSPVIGNVADKAVRATSNTAGKIGIRAGEVGTSILAEGTIFSVPEWMEGKRDKMDVWTDNLAQMAGMKVQGGFKTVANTIAGLHGNAKTGFRERLNGILDGNRQDLALTKDERAELEQGGYTDLKQLTDDAVASKGKKTATKDGKTATTSDDGKNVPVNRFEQLMADKNISEAARAKMYYYLTGHTLPMSTVTGGSMSVTKDADGKVTGYTVESTGYNGVITRRHFSDRKSADREMDRVHRQAELNNVGIGEHLYDEKAVKDGKPIEEGSAKLRSDIMDEYGIDVNEAYKKPYDKRSEEEQRAIDAYSDRLYDVTRNAEPAEDADPIGLSVAEREGADIVEENHLGTETPDTEVVQSTVTELRQAQTAWTEAMKSDTSLAEGFKTAQEKGLGMVEAYEWMLEQGYGTEESLAPLADVISASVKVVSMWRGTKESIEKTTQEHVSTWQWEGTDFGQGEATEPTMLYVTGKNGHRLIVKSGHIKFDAKGNAIEGDMIICLDETTGDMVHPSVKDVKFQGTESAKDYADRYRQRLQEINSKGYETLPVTPAEAESKPEGKATPEGMTEPESPLTEEPAKTEPSEANQDIPTEGEPETPDNGKIEGNYDKESGIPLDEEGEPLYEQVPKEQTVEDIFGKLDDANLARDYAKHKVSEAEKKLKSVSGKAPKMGTKINEYARKKTEYEAKVKEAQASVDYWKSVVEDIEKLTHTTDEELAEQKRELDGTAAKEEMKDNHETDVPDSGVALAASVLADAKITPDSLKKETGYGTKDLNRFVGMLAKKENGGVDLISLAEKLVEMDEQYNNRFFGGDAQEARNALLEALGQAKTRGELRALARPDEAKAIKEREEQRDKAYHDAYGMSYEEYLDFAEQEMAHLIGDMAHFDEEKYLQDYAAEITKQIDKEHGTGIKGHESAGEEPVHGTGGEVLSGEGVDDRGGSGSVEGHGEGKEEVRGGDRADAALEEEASGEVDEAHPIEGKESKPQSLKQERESHAHPKQSLKERTRKACESVAKELGVDIEWVDHLEDNGLFTTKDENGDNLARPLIRIARDAENPLTTVFGHEGIHAVRNLSEEAYQSLIKTAMSVVGDAEWQKRFDATKERYKKQNLTDDEIAEEVVADIVGEMITNRDMTEKIASRLSHPVLSALRDVAHKIWEAIKTFVGKGTTLNEQEQAVKDFTDTIERAFVEARAKAKADLEKRKAKGAKYSLREEAPTGEAENENNQSIEDVKKTDNEAFHHYSVASESESSTVEHGPADVAEHVAKVAEKTGGKVEQVNSIEEITNEKVKADIAKGKKVQGWYDEKTGKVYLYMPNIHDRYTAERVVWHETVGHKGMRGLLGDEGFKQYMQSLWYDLDNPVNAELRQYVRDRMAKDHLSMYDAIEEFIAESAEKGKGTAGFWNNVKNKVSDVLHEIGYRISPNVKDVQYMLWLAKNVQKNPNDPVWKMRAEAAKWKIEHSDMHLSEERGGEIADTGVHKSTDGMTDAEIERETDCKVHYSTAPSTATEIDLYNRAVGNVRAMLKESYQDSMNSLTELMKVLIPGMKRVEDVRATLNPRMMENLMAGRISAKGRKFANQEMKRLDRAYVGVLDAFNGKNTEERMREASLYMIEKHGLERNRVFYVRDKIAKERESDSMFADQLQQDWNVKKKELGDKLRNGQIDLKEYYKQMDEWIRGNVDRNYIASEHDYSGMHGMQGIANLRDAYDDAGAIAHVMDCEAKMEGNKKGSVAVLWSATKDATNFSIHEEYSSGYLSKDRYESLRDMFDWYVPLRKYDETTMEDVYTYIHGHVGSSNSIGMTVQKAKGRKSLSDVNILAQIGAMASGALYRGGSNEVRQAFARMVGEYEKAPANERVVTEIKGWAVKTTDSNGNIVWTEAHPPIPADDTNQETIAQEYYNWNQQMEAKKATGDAVEITGQSNIPYKFLPKGDRSQHIVSVWINGKRRDYLINGNPRAAQALNGMLNNESAKGALSAVNRFLAQSVTSWNPEFTLRNTVRDFGFASHLLEAKEGVNYWSKFEKHFFAMGLAPVGRTITAKSMNDVKNGLFVNLFKRYEQGTLDSNKPYHKWFAEFMDNGGMTGIATQQRFDEWKKKVVKDVAKMREGYMRHPWTLTKDIFSTIEVANEMAENITRFATFCASRESGRTAARSAYDAHEVSVNFNTRGSGNAVKTYSYEGMGDSAKALRNATGFFTGWMRNYTMFFNASVQSFCAFSRNIKAHPVRATATLMALPFAVGALMPWVNGLMQAWCDSDEDKKKLGIPDDPYGELPEFIRRDNLCFYIGKGEFVTVPLGIETRAFYGLGDLAAGYTFHPELQSQKNVAMDVAGQLSQIVPVGDFMSGSSFGDNAKGDAVTVLNKFLPSMYTPLSELVFNIDWKGQPIMRDGDYLDNSPSWMRAPRGTLTPLVKLNKKVNAETNDIMPGNENMKGDEVLDAMTNPALIEHLLDSYVGGTGTFVKRTGKVVNRAIIKAQGGNADIESKDIPFVRSLLYTPSETNAMARTKAKWYKYKEDIEKDAANMKVLKRRDVPLDEQIANFAQLQKLQNNANAQRVNIYERASKQIKRLNKRKARAQDDEESKYFDQQVNMIMEDAVKEMDAIKDK